MLVPEMLTEREVSCILSTAVNGVKYKATAICQNCHNSHCKAGDTIVVIDVITLSV